MIKDKFIKTLIREISYRTDKGYPDFDNPDHINIMSEILDDWGLSEIKDELIQNLLSEQPAEKEDPDDGAGADEPDRIFQHPRLNMEIEYTDEDGERKTGLVGNLLRKSDETEAGRAAQDAIASLSDEEKEKINRELGSQRGDETDPDMKFDGEKEEPKADGEEGGEEGTEGGEGEGDGEGEEMGTSVDPDTDAGEDYIDSLPDGDPAKKAALKKRGIDPDKKEDEDEED